MIPELLDAISRDDSAAVVQLLQATPEGDRPAVVQEAFREATSRCRKSVVATLLAWGIDKSDPEPICRLIRYYSAADGQDRLILLERLLEAGCHWSLP